MPTATVNGIEMYYEVSGEGPPLVFAHGAGGNHASWWQQTGYFSRSYQVVTFDHRGFGHSLDVANGPGRSAFAEDLEGLLDHLGIEQTALVAQSMGGWTCLAFAARHPERVRALVMADTPGGVDDPSVREVVAEVAKENEGKPLMNRALGASFQKLHPAETELYKQIYSFNFPIPDTSGLQSAKGPTAAELAGLPVPVMFLVGQEDVSTPPKVIKAAHKLVPSSTYVEVPGAGHSVYFEKADVFNYLVEDFLSKAPR